jgi:hypothetical protein
VTRLIENVSGLIVRELDAEQERRFTLVCVHFTGLGKKRARFWPGALRAS